MEPGTVHLGRHHPVLPSYVEEELNDHFKTMERSLYGSRVSDVLHLAFEIAEQYHMEHPFNMTTKKAGREWLRGFFNM